MTTPNATDPTWFCEFRDRLRTRARDTEARGALADETVAEAREAGFFSLLLPARFGGAELGLGQFLNTTATLAAGCTASAWTLSFYAVHAWMLCKFPLAAQEELFADGRVPLVPAPLAPTGKATAEDDGYRVRGRWEWATGWPHADMVMVTAMASDTGLPVFCLLDRDEVEAEDNWHMAGMMGTGSNAVRVRDRFVPRHRTVDVLALRAGATEGQAVHELATLTYPLGATLALVASTSALGAADAAVEFFGERMREKVMPYSGARQAEQPTTQLRLGEAITLVHAARALWRDAIRELEASGGDAGEDTLVRTRMAAAGVVRLSCMAADTLAASAGAGAGHNDWPLQTALPAVQKIRGPGVFDWDRAMQIVGKRAMGIDATPADLL